MTNFEKRINFTDRDLHARPAALWCLHWKSPTENTPMVDLGMSIGYAVDTWTGGILFYRKRHGQGKFFSIGGATDRGHGRLNNFLMNENRGCKKAAFCNGDSVSVACLVYCLARCLVHWLVYCLTRCLVHWLVYWLVRCLVHRYDIIRFIILLFIIKRIYIILL